MPQRLLLPEHFTEGLHVLSVHAVQHHIQHFLHRAPGSWPRDVIVAQLCAASGSATVESGRAPLLVPALLRLPGFFFFTCRSCQILFVLPLQPLMQLLVALLLLLPLLSAFPSLVSRSRRCQSLSFGVLFIKIFFSDPISPVPEVFLLIIKRKIIIRCKKKKKKNTARLGK